MVHETSPAPSLGRRPALAALLGLLVPGLGHLYLGRRERGAAILTTALALTGLALWLELTALAPWGLPFWLWQAWEARGYAQGRDPGTVRLLLTGAILVYAIGWQVTEIDLQRFVANAPKIRPFVASLLRPNYLEREISYAAVRVQFTMPCGPETSGPPAASSGPGPVLRLDRACADPGDPITVYGEGFPPNLEGELWFENTIGDRARLHYQGELVGFVTGSDGRFQATVTAPEVATDRPQPQFIEARYVTEVGPLQPSETARLVVYRMGETIAQALMATTWGALFAVLISFFAARNLMRVHPLTFALYYVVRTLLNILRAIEPLIMAIVFVVWVGLGPFAGVLALTMHSIAALGKLYSEAIENIEPGPIEAITATGANRIQVIWFGVLPQVWPPFVAFTVYRWDINVRMSTIIGFVGGGGIGFLLQQWIRLTDFRSASAALWAIALVVTVLDFFSSEVRKRIV